MAVCSIPVTMYYLVGLNPILPCHLPGSGVCHGLFLQPYMYSERFVIRNEWETKYTGYSNFPANEHSSWNRYTLT